MKDFWPTPLLRRAALRHLRRRPWLAGLTTAGVALAVAVVVGIDLANASAEHAFRLSVDDVAGRATHQVVGGPLGIHEEVYAQLRRSGLAGVRNSAPVIEGRGRIDAGPSSTAAGRSVRLLGVDPWAEAPVRSFTSGLAGGPDTLTAFLTEPGAVAMSTVLASLLDLKKGDLLTFAPRGPDSLQEPLELKVIVVIEPADERQRRAWDDLLLVDIATAQQALGRFGRLDRIDLVLPTESQPEITEQIAGLLPAGLELRTASSRAGALEEMTQAFRLNLTALSMLALLVGMFLIYNAMSFLVVERRPLLARFRAMGVSRGQILTMVLFEAAVLGAVGSAAGLVLGQLLARGLLQLITQTINDLYFVLSVREVSQPFASLALGAALGVGGALLAALGPALEAAAVQPQTALRRSAVESKQRHRAVGAALLGLGLIAAAGLLVALPGRHLSLGFAAVFVGTLGFAALIPLATLAGSRLLTPLAGFAFGNLGRMAARDIGAAISRTGIAVAALTIAVATTLGVAIMVSSFRATLVDWLEITLKADLYASPASQDGRGAGPPLSPSQLDALTGHPSVAHASTYRRVEVASSLGPVQLHALHAEAPAFEVFSFKNTVPSEIFPRFRAGEGVLISEPFAYRHGLGPGDTLDLLAEGQSRSFEVLAVFYDYASDRGLVMIDSSLYQDLWQDPRIQSVGLYLQPGANADRVVEDLRTQLADADVRIVANRELRRVSLAIFDRTFRITDVLRALAVAVAFFGVFSALMALQLERGRELAVLRALGLEPKQVRRLLAAQNALLGALAGLLATPLGVAMAAMLVFVINKRSFGWTLQLTVEPNVLLQGVGLAMFSALLAGWLPARRMLQRNPASALREE